MNAAPERADRELRRRDRVHRKLAEELYALDAHDANVYLRDGDLTGATAAAARDTAADLAALWSRFTAAGVVLDRARDVRSRRARLDEDGLAELTALLHEETIALDAAGLPTADSGAPTAEHVRLDVLHNRMTAAAESIRRVYTEVDGACTLVADRLATIAAAVDDASRLAELLDLTGENGPGAPHALQTGLRELRAAALADPLDPALAGRLDRFADRVAPVLIELAALDRLRTGSPARLLDSRTAITALAAAETEAAELARTAHTKIADVELPAAPPRAAPLRNRLGELRRLATARRWRALAEALTAVDADTAAARTAADALAATATALLDRRTELRGRLRAYQMKAARLGAAEQTDLAARYDTARRLLWTAPCDLRAATRAVRDFQQALLAMEESG